MDWWHVWVIAAIVLLIAELYTPEFVVACFGVGCLASALVAALGLGLKWQLVGFSLGTLMVFLTIRPLFLKYCYRATGGVRTNVDALIGRIGRVTEKIDPDTHEGRVKVGGEDWRGVPVDDVVIEAGQKVEVVRVDGTKLLVKVATRAKED